MRVLLDAEQRWLRHSSNTQLGVRRWLSYLRLMRRPELGFTFTSSETPSWRLVYLGYVVDTIHKRLRLCRSQVCARRWFSDLRFVETSVAGSSLISNGTAFWRFSYLRLQGRTFA